MICRAHRLAASAVALAAISACCASAAYAAPAQSARGLLTITAGPAISNSDVFLVGDDRPRPYGGVGARVGVEYGINDRYILSAKGTGDGSSFQFTSGLGQTGNVRHFSPGFQFGLNRVLWIGDEPRASVGLAFRYAEVRSWVHSFASGFPFNSTGPTNFLRGVVLHAQFKGPAFARAGFFAEAAEFVYAGHANDPSVIADYDWLGRSSEVAVGLYFVVLRRNGTPPANGGER